ncbi:MAG: hypothetical protein P4L83_08250 [Nevskia sp.]|nr:hypothetical protein [Nevskia sp.]
MRPSDTAITPERLQLLKQIRDANAGSKTEPDIYMDDLNVFARLRLVHFDREGRLSLTESGSRILTS